MKRIKNYLLTKIAPFFLQLIVRFIYLSSKKKFHYPNVSEEEPLVVAVWHGDLLMQPLSYRNFRKNGKAKIIVSEHKDGLIIKKVCEYLDIGSIPGSSSKGGIKALKNALRALKSGFDVAITPDGPRGPRFSIADGIVAISKKTDTRIVVFSSKPQSYWQINSWDKFVIPKPFGIIDFYVSEPFSIEHLNLDEAKNYIKEKMLENTIK